MRRRVAGIDEAGRGPLAGPVVAAAVILRPGRPIDGVADSKVLSPDERSALDLVIRREALCFGIGWADRAEIDALNILQATFLAMRRALLAMTLTPDHVLVDGNRLPHLGGLGKTLTARAIVGRSGIIPGARSRLKTSDSSMSAGGSTPTKWIPPINPASPGA